TGLTALAALAELSPWKRIFGATLVAVPYLAASYFAQAAFKETAEALFVLAFALYLAAPEAPDGGRWARLRFAPAAAGDRRRGLLLLQLRRCRLAGGDPRPLEPHPGARAAGAAAAGAASLPHPTADAGRDPRSPGARTRRPLRTLRLSLELQ